MSGKQIGDEEWPGISKLIEECGEVLQVAGKLIGTGGETIHWDGSDLVKCFADELGDLCAAISFVLDANPQIDPGRVAQRAADKIKAFREWHEDGHTSK